MDQDQTYQKPDEPAPLPWVYHILLGMAFNGDVFVKSVFFLPTRIVLPVTVIKLGALFALVAMLAVRRRPRFLVSKTTNQCRWALCAYAVLGFYMSFFRSGNVDVYPLVKAGAIVVIALLGVWVVYRVLETRADLERFAMVLVAFALWICFTTLAEVFRGEIAVLIIGADKQQFGILGMPIPVRMGIGVRVAPVVLLSGLLFKSVNPGWKKQVSGILANFVIPIVFFVVVIVSGHRSALAAMILMIGYRLARQMKFREMAKIGVGVFVLLLIVGNLSADFEQTIDRAKTLFDFQTRFTDSSARHRGQFYTLAMDVFADHPIAGAGFGGFQKKVGDTHSGGIHPHNIFMEYISDAGAIGLAIVLFLVVAVFSRLWVCKDEITIAFAGMVIGYFFIAMFSGDFMGNNNLYMLIGLLPLMERLKRPQQHVPAS